MKSKNCKCLACGNDLTITDITETSRFLGQTYDGKLISSGSYPDNEVELSARCMCCGTEYIINGYKHNLEKLWEW